MVAAVWLLFLLALAGSLRYGKIIDLVTVGLAILFLLLLVGYKVALMFRAGDDLVERERIACTNQPYPKWLSRYFMDEEEPSSTPPKRHR